MNNSELGARIRRARLAAGLTQKQLADRLHITDRAVSKWERGLSAPDIALLEPLADALHLTLTQLIAGGEEVTTPEQAIRQTVEYAQTAGRTRLHRIYSLTATSFAAQMLILLLWTALEGRIFPWMDHLFALALLAGFVLSAASLLAFLVHLLTERRTGFLEAVLGIYPCLLILAVCGFDGEKLGAFLLSPLRILFGF